METKEVLQITVNACDDKHAEDIVVLDMKQISLIADYFVICHGNTERQVQAIARGVKDALHEHQIPIKQMEGFEQARWVLIDTGEVLCHIFHKTEREYYHLERLWGDAAVVPVEIGKS